MRGTHFKHGEIPALDALVLWLGTRGDRAEVWVEKADSGRVLRRWKIQLE